MSSLQRELDFKRLQYVDPKKKDLVFGVIRNIQRLFPKDIRFTMPDSIINICLLFYFDGDQWDPAYIGQDVEHKGSRIKALRNSDSSVCFGTTCVKANAIITWKIKLIKFGYATAWYNPYIGIIKDTGDDLQLYKGVSWYSNGYQFCGTQSVCIRPGSKSYGEPFKKPGSVIIMTLDTIDWTLSYNINGTDYGVAFSDIDKHDYRLCVLLGGKDTELELL